MRGLYWVAGVLVAAMVAVPKASFAASAAPTPPAAAHQASGQKAQPAGTSQPASFGAPDEASARAKARQTGRPVEVTSLGTEYKRVLANPSGTMTLEEHTSPIRTRRGSGWVPIDTTLHVAPDGTVQPGATVTDLALSNGGTGPLARLGHGGAEMSIAWPARLPAPSLSGDTATYAEVLPGVDLQVKATAEGFSQYLTVKSHQAALNPALARFHFKTSTRGLALSTGPDGTLVAKDAGGATVFAGGAPSMWDTAGPTDVEPRHARMGLELSSGDLAVVPDAGMLADPNLRFPLTIDPSVVLGMVIWGNVEGLQASSSNLLFDRGEGGKMGYVLDPGGFYVDYRSLYEFSLAGLGGKHVLDARFYATVYWSYVTCSDRPVNMYLAGYVDGNTTWNSTPWGGWLDQQSGSVCNGQLRPMSWGNNLAGQINSGVNGGGWGTVTVGLVAPNEDSSHQDQWKRFCAGGTTHNSNGYQCPSGGGDDPYMSVTYNSIPTAPDGLTSNGSGCGTYVTSTDPQNTYLGAAVHDPDGDSLNAHFGLYQTGNPNTALATFTASGVPNGTQARWNVLTSYGLVDGGDYSWLVQTEDGIDWSPVAGWCEFKYDKTPPQAPTNVSSSTFPGCVWPPPTGCQQSYVTAGKVNNPGTFTISPPSYQQGEIAGYLVGLNGANQPTSSGVVSVAANSSNQTATATVTPTVSGPNVLHVWTKELSGLVSPQAVDYDFPVAPGDGSCPPPAPPTITFQAAPPVLGQNFNVTLGTSPVDTTVTQYNWSFEDNSLSNSATTTGGGSATVQAFADTPGQQLFYAAAVNNCGQGQAQQASITIAASVADSSGHGYNGFGSGVTELQPGLIQGDPDTAMTFDGQTSFIGLPSAAFPAYPVTGSTTSYTMTFEAWFQTTTGGVIFSQNAGGSPVPSSAGGYVPAVYVDSTGAVRESLFWPGAQNVTTAHYNDGRPHHVVAVYSGGSDSLYVDGQLIGTQSRTEISYSNNYSYFLGTGYTVNWPNGNGGWYYFNGTLDEVAVYSTALTTIQTHYNVGTGRVSGASYSATVLADKPSAYYRLDDDPPPSAPLSVSAVAGNAQATVSWAPPASNGGSAITGYTVTTSPGGARTSVGGSTTSTTITGLTNGTAYTFRVKATNAVGSGPASAPSNAVTPATVPGAPTGVTATAGNAQATVSWVAPASNGGSAITGYTVTAAPGGATASVSGSTTTATVTGLTNGTAHTFTVTATNAVGTGAASAASSAVTPATVPEAPTAVTAVAGNAQATVSWTAPASNGGSAITGYTVTASPGGATASINGSMTTATVTGLSNGTAYTFTVTATNAVGTGAASAASSAVTPATVPGAPTGVTATAGNAQATVSWVAPASNGGSAITSYTVTASPGGATASVNGSTTTATVTGLTSGTAYTFTVTATNAAGTGAASAASGAVTPLTVPGAPTGVTATAGNAQATVSWTAPASNGGSAITGYTVTATPGGATASVNGSTTTATVTGLTNGTAYTITVTATNAVGTGPASAASNSVTPAAGPTFVQQVSANPGGSNSSLSVTFGSNVTAGNRIVVVVGVRGENCLLPDSICASTSSVTDSAGNTYTEVASHRGGVGSPIEESVWTAPVSSGGGTMPTITVTPNAPVSIGVMAVEYSGLSQAAGSSAVDVSAIHGAVGPNATSGPTPATTGAGELAVGAYVGPGDGSALSYGSGWTGRVNVSPSSALELAVEDQVEPSGAQPNANVGVSSNASGVMATVVFKSA